MRNPETFLNLVSEDARATLLADYETPEQAAYAALEIAAIEAAEQMMVAMARANTLSELLAEENSDCHEFRSAVREALGDAYPLSQMLVSGIIYR